MAEGTGTAPMRLRLYILDASARSRQALDNLKALAGEHLGSAYDLEIVDVAQEPMRALRDGILITPTLMRLTAPTCWIVGDLSDTESLLRALARPRAEP